MYIYYECKDTEKQCRVSIRQELLEEQFDFLLTKIDPGETELDRARENLVSLHGQKSSSRKDQRKELQEHYDKLEQTINEQIAALPSLKSIGLEGNAIQQLKNLKTEQDTTKAQLVGVLDEGSAWIEKMIGCFELLQMAQEILKHGSPRVRDKMLKAMASNYPLIDGKVVPELRSPYKEAAQREGLPEWWAKLYDVRTEVIETHSLLEGAFSLLRQEAYA